MSKDYGYPSFELICRASSGDEVAIKEILKFYNAYISKFLRIHCIFGPDPRTGDPILPGSGYRRFPNYACVRFTTLKVVKSLCRLMKN